MLNKGNKKLWKEIELKDEQNGEISKIYEKMKSSYNNSLNQIKECNDRLEENDTVIEDLTDNLE